MKNQYVGDIGDYGKYSLLRAFLDAGIKVGVNWYHTKDDGTADGRFKDYLYKEKYQVYDPFVFNALKKIIDSGNCNVEAIQNSIILPDVSFFSDSLEFPDGPKERVEKRRKWFNESIDVLYESDLVFLDPDNGLLVKDDSSMKGAKKYALPREVRAYWEADHDVVYYCHRGRRNDEQWQKYMRVMQKSLSEARIIVLTYHKRTQRSYVFLVRKRNYDRYRKIIDNFIKTWDGVFTDEKIETKYDGDFVIYNETLTSSVKDDCLHLKFFVYGENYNCNKQYVFTAEDTSRLFSLIEYETFIRFCRERRLKWMERFLEDNDIHPKIE